jgi:DNA-binding MarR family transcriptional regulator
MTPAHPNPSLCNCLAVRKAARHVTQHYDRYLADLGLRTTQYSILNLLKRLGPTTINALADAMVTDRTTLGRNVLPLQRDGLITIAPGEGDRRTRLLALTETGTALLQSAYDRWAQAQDDFEGAFGADRAAQLRRLLHDVTSTRFASDDLTTVAAP